MNDHLILSHLHKHFDSVQAVNDVCLQINRGELVTLLGPSGCGKTTTLHMIAGFHHPDKGEIMLNGKDITYLPPYKRNTPMVFQEYALFPHMTVFENIAYGLKVQKKKVQIRKKVEDILTQLGLVQVIDRFPNQLSGGQQQRIALARALVLDPEVLLLDEPLSNLDAKLRKKVRYEINGLRKQFNITTIFVTHDQEEALSISDRIAVMNKGIVEQFGDPSEIYYHPTSEFVANFVGETNLLSVTIIECVKHNNEYLIKFRWHNQIFQVQCSQSDVNKDQQRKLLLRPEAINLYATNQCDDTIEQGIRGSIKQCSFLGTIIRYWIDVEGQEIIVDDSKILEHGLFSGMVLLSFNNSNTHFLQDDPSSGGDGSTNTAGPAPMH